MIREPRRSTLTDTRCPYTTLLRSVRQGARTGDAGVAGGHRRAFDEGCAGTAAGGPDTRCFPQRRGSARCVCLQPFRRAGGAACGCDRSEEHTSELQSLIRTSYAVLCLTKKTTKHHTTEPHKK